MISRLTRIVSLITCALLLAGLTALIPTPASAVTFSKTYGSYAGGTIPSVVGGELCNMMYGPLYYGCVYSPTLRTNAFVMDRAPATTGTQIITVDIQVWRYANGAWQQHTSQRSQATLARGVNSVALPGLSRTVDNGHLSVTAAITWWTGDSRRLGGYTVSWDRGSDYYCRTQVLSCQTGPGWIKHGA